MATTQLADIIEPSVFNPYVQERSTALSLLFNSGVIASHPEITRLTQTGGSQINIPFWNDLADTDPNIGSDDPAVKATAEKMGSGQDVAIMHYLNKSWSSMDISAVVAGNDPMKAIGDLVAGYWERAMQKRLIYTLNGVIAENIANDGGDMVVDISNDAVPPILATELISGEAVIDAAQTMGDAKDKFTLIAMHSVVHARLQKQNLITTVHNSDGKVMFDEYMGKKVLVDDGLPAVAGVNRITYTTYLLGAGAAAYAEGSPKVPHEVKRDPDAGNGEGQETLFSRRHLVMHLRGVKWTNTAIVGKSPTVAEIQNPLNWARVLDRKKVRVVALKTNG